MRKPNYESSEVSPSPVWPPQAAYDLETLVGHHESVRFLRANMNRFDSGTFLLTGPSGIGKRLSVWFLMREFLCESKQERICLKCPSCKSLSQRQHISVLEILPEGAVITVEETEKIIQFVSLRGLSTKQFVIIDEAHLLNHQSGNKLLKTLEEPPKNVFFVLITSQKSRVLKTIQSRSQIVRFHPLSPEQLRKIFPRVALETLVRARGSVARVLELEDPDTKRRLEFAKSVWTQMDNPDFLTEFPWREDWKSRETFQILLESWEMELVEQIYLTKSKENILSKESVFEKTTLFQEIQKLRDAVLAKNADPILALESFWVSLRRVHEGVHA